MENQQDAGTSATPTGLSSASQIEPVPVSPLRVSIPSAPTIASDIDAIITREHDRQMNRYGFLRDADGCWRASRHIEDEDAGTKANAIFLVRYQLRQYFQGILTTGDIP